MIESLFSTDILTEYYRSATGMDVGVQWSAGFVEQISHRFPNMHVLEVGKSIIPDISGLGSRCP